MGWDLSALYPCRFDFRDIPVALSFLTGHRSFVELQSRTHTMIVQSHYVATRGGSL